MDGAEAVWFLGDLDDPWVRAIRDSLRPVSALVEVDCRGEFPERPFDPASPPEALILHRSRITQAEILRLERWRPRDPQSPGPSDRRPRLVLCHGPFVRYAELERCGRSVDLLVPEATATDALPRQLAALLGRPSGRDRRQAVVEVVSTDHALRSVLMEACVAAGYEPSGRPWPWSEEPRPAETGSPVVTIWDVPVLEPEWPDQMRQLGRLGPVVALLGFADRATVERAREHGAAACLELPFHLEDLVHALDRLAGSLTTAGGPRLEQAHQVPPFPAGRTRGRAAIRNRPAPSYGWADEESVPRMN